jgi:acetyl esterase/lipase/lysophospholipase L1-like esterase
MFIVLRLTLLFKKLSHMKRLAVLVFLFIVAAANAQQKVIPLYNGAAPGSENWNWNEAENEQNMFNTKVVYNVTKPTLTVFTPDASVATGTAMVICPGGGFHILSINSEGNDVANWLVKKGVTCFVLKYRLVHSLTNDPVKELIDIIGKPEFTEKTKTLIPLAVADGREAIAYVRDHAAEYNIKPDHIGIIGFSAGALVAGATAYNYNAGNRPDFVAPIYGGVSPEYQGTIASDAPPMFITAASDDQLGLAPSSIDLYNKWLESKRPVELHMYVKGGHGFGMRTQNIPTDTWIDRFGEWLGVQGFIKATTQVNAQQVEGMQKMLADWANLKRYGDANKNLKNASDKRVVFMGNSITDAWVRIDSAFFASHNYIDRGISGQTTPQMLVRFRPDVIELKPAAVVILAGINDIAGNTGPMTLEQTFGNIVSMAELAKANNIRVVISSVLPAYDFPWHPGLQPADKVVKLNGMLKGYANKNGFVYLDYFSAMADERKGLPKSLSEDGVHPNLAGYKIMEPLAQKAIAEALKHK